VSGAGGIRTHDLGYEKPWSSIGIRCVFLLVLKSQRKAARRVAICMTQTPVERWIPHGIIPSCRRSFGVSLLFLNKKGDKDLTRLTGKWL
jgi:hypothetical protein